MDTSKKYIKMCEEAKEIQELFKKERFGWVVDTPTGKEIAAKLTEQVYVNGRDDVIFIGEKPIWLPRQDQLQEILIKEQGWKMHPRDIAALLYHVGAWVEKHLPPFDKPGYYSMEQLWLAVIMKEVFHKEWKDGTWKKAS